MVHTSFAHPQALLWSSEEESGVFHCCCLPSWFELQEPACVCPPVLALQTRQGTTVYPRLVSAPSVGITDLTGHHGVSPADLELSGITRLYLPSAEMKGAHHKPDPQNPFIMKPSLHPPDLSPDPFLQCNGESLPHLTSLTCSCKGLGSVRSTP